MPAGKLEQRLRVTLPGDQCLTLHRLAENPDGLPVLLLHGLADDASVFLLDSHEGLAHFLARQGFDVYLPDFSSLMHWRRQTVGNLVTQKIPAILDTIINLRGSNPCYWFCQGWGGALANRFLATYPGYRTSINGLVHFANLRIMASPGMSKPVWLDGLQGSTAELLSRIRGFIPVRQLRRHARYEGIALDSFGWLQEKSASHDWLGYGSILSRGLDHPPALYFVTRNDLGYCNPPTVKAYMQQLASHNGRLVILGRKEGNLQDYHHHNMLDHPDAGRDHFPFMVNWIQDMGRLRHEAIHGDDPHDSDARHTPAPGRQ